jgi:hypothetical protein
MFSFATGPDDHSQLCGFDLRKILVKWCLYEWENWLMRINLMIRLARNGANYKPSVVKLVQGYLRNMWFFSLRLHIHNNTHTHAHTYSMTINLSRTHKN